MNKRNQEFISKMMRARQLEKEAIQSLFPEHVREHLDIIEKECREMLVECLQYKPEKQEQDEKKRAKKVTIE